MSDIYSIAQSIKGGHSGTGNSFYELTANCGRRRNLLAQIGEVPRDPDYVEPDWAVRGTYYHLLHQFWQEGKLPEGAVLDAGVNDELWQEACTLFSWFQQSYAKDFFGNCLATEIKYPRNSAEQEVIAQYFNVPMKYAPTARFDMYTQVTDEHVDRAARDGILLPGPGRYIVDYKHGKQHNKDDGWKYTNGVQPLLYLTLDRLLNPDNPARGMIFTKVSMTREKSALKLKDTSFRVYVAYFQPSFFDEARSMIQFAYNSMVANQPNRYACEDCPFFRKECPGF